MKKRYSMILMIFSVVFAATGIVKALDVIIPHAFVSGTPAKASDVNANFETLADAVNDRVDIAGGTMTGDLTVPKVAYSTPRVHNYCISGDMFRPRTSTDAYSSGLGNGGARIVTEGSSGTMMAQANLPDGATITEITYHIVDNDPDYDLVFQTRVQFFTGAYALLHPSSAIKSTGASTTVQTLSVTPTSQTLVNNTNKAVVVMIYPDTETISRWSTNFYIRGVSFTYTLSEAP